MTTQIRIGDKAKTIGPLKPAGKIRVNGRTLDASSEGDWIDPEADVVIVGGSTRRAVVRVCSDGTNHLRKSGELLPQEKSPESTPLQSPPAWVERIPAVAIGSIVGVVVIPLVWLAGTPITLDAVLVPVAGAAAGWLFRTFVGTAVHFLGPREDHRPLARQNAGIVLICSIIGSFVGLNVGFGFLGLGCGIVVGALIGGGMTYIGMIVLT